MSTESIASSSQAQAGADAHCANCGAPLAADQRYCLECGERRMPMSSVLLDGSPLRRDAPASAPAPPPARPPAPPGADAGGPQRNTTLTVIAGVGVLLLAMGVGVLIGRAGAPKQTAAPAASVITVASSPTGSSTSAGETSFTGDWSAGTSGYTVELETLPQSGTTVSAVEAAKSSASAKGVTAVGALKSEEFTSLASGSYVIYSGVYHTKAQAEKALGAVKKSFPSAKVIRVANGGSSSSNGSSAPETPSSSPGGVGNSPSHPAPPSVLNSEKGAKGKSYEEKSKNLPNVVETG